MTINNRVLPMTTTIQYMDVDGGSTSYDYVRIVVSVGYRVGSADRVTLETFRSP